MNYDFIAIRYKVYIVSLSLLVICLLSLSLLKLNLAIDFRGGYMFDNVTHQGLKCINSSNKHDIDKVHLGNDTRIVVNNNIPKNKLDILKQCLDNQYTSFKSIGAKWGYEILYNSILALAIFLIVLCVFFVFIFDFFMCLSAIITLMHDMIISIGIYHICRFIISPATITGFLTVLGYSLYDTVIIFGRIKELQSENKDISIKNCINDGINKSINRSINTAIFALIPIILLFASSMFINFGTVIQELSLSLLIGIIIGMLSSIFLSPVLYYTLNKYKKVSI